MNGTLVFIQNRDFYGARIVHIPLLDALKRLYPEDPLTVFSPIRAATFFQEIGLADEVVLYERVGPKLLRALRSRKPARIVSLRPQSQGVSLAIYLSGTRERIGFNHAMSGIFFSQSVARNPGIYRVQNYLNLLPRLPAGFRWAGYLEELAEQSTVQLPPDPYLCLLPGGGSGAFKRWPIGHFIQTCRILATTFPRTSWILGPDETAYTEVIRETLGASARLVQEGSVSDIARSVGGAALVIANDCGPSHIPQIMQRPYIGLFSNFDGEAGKRIQEWFHPHLASRAIASPPRQDIDTISPDEVAAAAQGIFSRDASAT